MQEASKAGAHNRAPDGIGWADVHLIKQPSTDYSAVGLSLKAAVSVLEPIMLTRVRSFTATATAGFDPSVHDAGGTYDEDAYCCGFGASCFIKLDVNGDLSEAHLV